MRRRLAGIVFREFGRPECRKRLRRAYRRARDQWWLAVSDPTDENLHEWRKLTKILLNQLRLVRPWATTTLPRYRTALAELDERLGQARDSSHLAGILRGVPVAEVVELLRRRAHDRHDEPIAQLRIESTETVGPLHARAPRRWKAATTVSPP